MAEAITGMAGQVAAVTTSNQITKKALQHVRAHVIEIPTEKRIDPSTKNDPNPETRNTEDPFGELEHRGLIIVPPFDPLTLAMLHEQSTELGQCIEAMAINIEGFGHRFIPRVKLDDPENQVDDKTRSEVLKERARLTNFFEYVNNDTSFTEFRKRLRKDMESGGNGYFEVIRNAAGRPQSFAHIPGWQMRSEQGYPLCMV